MYRPYRTPNIIRLTQGGEPTFVSVDDPDGAEWNTAALGPTKRNLAADLFHRLREKYAPLGLMHFGQGKWYPGEQLPRWSLNCFWRKDGQPLDPLGDDSDVDIVLQWLDRMVRELKTKLGFSQGILDAMTVPCLVTDTSGRVSFVNAHLLGLLERNESAQACLGRRIEEPGDHRGVEQLLVALAEDVDDRAARHSSHP